MIIHVVGGSHDVKDDFGGVVDLKFVVVNLHFTVGLHLHTAFSRQVAFDAFMLHVLYRGGELVEIGFLSVDSEWEYLGIPRCVEAHVQL